MLKIIFFLSLSLCLSACSTLGYYAQAIGGHNELMGQAKPIDEILADEKTPKALKQKLQLAQQARVFATTQLGLPDNQSYQSYTDLKRPFVVWNVIATPAHAIEPKQWCFLVVGCLSYRGYFDKADATALADELRAQGFDVAVGGVTAYSTLGWFDDPLLNTMLRQDEATMVGVIFHELAHQLIYIDDDSAFNEAFATAVEQEGLRRWFLSRGTPEQYSAYEYRQQQRGRIYQLLISTREKLRAVYNASHTMDEKQQQKQQLFAQLKQQYQQEKGDYTGFDRWMAQDLNNAHLALVATYQQKVPNFMAVLQSVRGDMVQFYERVRELAAMPALQRQITLENDYGHQKTALQP